MANNFDSISNELQAMSEREIKRRMHLEGRRLEQIALKLWRETMSKYEPKKYAVHLGKTAGTRTDRSEQAVKLGSVKKLPDGSFGIELTWENELVYHDSIFKNQPKGHSVMLISSGWHSKKLEKRMGRRINRFTYFEGTGYLYKVYKEYMNTAPEWIKLDTQWSGNTSATKK